MKHIVILIDQLYCYGGIERLVAIKANYWTEDFNYEVTIISTEQKQKPFAYALSDKVQFIDLAINFDRNSSYFKSHNLLKFLKNIKELNKELKFLKPDFIIVASHIPITYFINFIKGGAKTVKEFHFTKWNNTANFKSKIESYFLAKYDFLAVLSKEEQQFYTTDNTIVLANPLIEESQLNDKDLDIEKQNKAIFLGRIAPVKNIESLIEIWSEFIKKYPNWILEIFGDYNNDYGLILKDKVSSLSLDNCIIFKGEIKNTMEAINQSKIMLLTSHQECFPLVILESLSQGVPVFSYDCPTGPRNILTDGYDSRIIENKNSEQFVKALEDFASNTIIQKKLGEHALVTAQKYSLPNIMEQWNNEIFKK
jgi:glycosyltransferase involved in cell wall biosynthesis